MKAIAIIAAAGLGLASAAAVHVPVHRSAATPTPPLLNATWAWAFNRPAAYRGDKVILAGRLAGWFPHSKDAGVFLDSVSHTEPITVVGVPRTIKPGSYIEVLGTLDGAIGWTVNGHFAANVPLVKAQVVEPVSPATYLAILSHTSGPYTGEAPQHQNGLTLHVSQVRVSFLLTRITVVATNTSPHAIVIETQGASAIQHTPPVVPMPLLPARDGTHDFPVVLAPHHTATATLVFGPLIWNGVPFTLTMSASSSDVAQVWKPFVFRIPAPTTPPLPVH